jgi:Protein of unknown function (DUF3238)
MSARKAITRAIVGAAVLLGAASCSDLPPFPADPAPPALTAVPCTPPAHCNLALNPSRGGYPSPLLSDPGWGGGWDTWDIVDGQTYYPWWAEGLALNYGGHRQVTIDFGTPQTFNQVVAWHHLDCCIHGNNVPGTVWLEYYDGGAWHPIPAFARIYDIAYAPPPGMYGAVPDRYMFPPVTGSGVRWSYDGSGPNVLGATGGWHGWLYEMEVFGTAAPTGEHEVTLTAFIPGNHVEFPTSWNRYIAAAIDPCRRQGGLYFSGDTRGFDPDAASFRTRQRITVVLDAALDADGVKDGTVPENLAGVTHLYAADALPVLDAADDDGVPGDCSLLHEQGQASTAGMHVSAVRTGPTTVAVQFTGAAANPLVIGTPAIDWSLLLTLERTGGSTQWTLTGEEDGFPAFEMYVDGHPVYQRDSPPPHRFLDALGLLPGFRNKTVNGSGTLPD